MEFFGLTTLGVSDPIKFYMRSDYKEPDKPPNMMKKVQEGDYDKPFVEVVRDLDIYSGVLDGFSYKSYHRLNVNKCKGFYKPVGPKDIYRDSLTQNMDYGWNLNDPVLKDQTWFRNDSRWPKPNSDSTRFLDMVLRKDKRFVM